MGCNCDNIHEDALRIVRGNSFGLRIQVSAKRMDGTVVTDFDLSQAEASMKVLHAGKATAKNFVIEGNDAIVSFDGGTALGWWGLEMSGVYDDEQWRFCVDDVFQIVEANAKANVPSWAFVTDDTYIIAGSIVMSGGGGGAQADWAETDPTSPAFILNKPDLSIYATNAAMATALAGKQATLVSGTNIKTINGESVLGAGNIEINALDPATNIDTLATPGFYSYDDGAASWLFIVDATAAGGGFQAITQTKVGELLYVRTAMYNGNTGQFMSAWSAWDSSYYFKQEIQDLLAAKADKVSGATTGNFAGLNANGNLTDSGSKASDFATAAQGAKADAAAPQSTTYTKAETNALLDAKQGTLTFDTAPTASSTNPVTSGGVKSALDLKADASALATANTNIAELQAAYEGLTQSDIVVGALPASGVANIIYRVPGTSSYSDYMWDGTQFVLLATYDNAIDNVPTDNSNNLVKSGGVYNAIGIVDEKIDLALKSTNLNVDLSNVVIHTRRIVPSSLSWGQATSATHFVIAVAGYSKGEITGNDDRTGHIAYLANYDTTQPQPSGNPEFVAGTTLIEVPMTNVMNIDIPIGARYLYVEASTSNNSTMPQSIRLYNIGIDGKIESLETNVETLDGEIETINESLDIADDPIPSVTFSNTGYYVKPDGTIGESTNWKQSNIFELKSNQVVKITCSTTRSSAVVMALTNQQGTIFMPVVMSASDAGQNRYPYQYTAQDDCYMIVQYHGITGTMQVVNDSARLIDIEERLAETAADNMPAYVKEERKRVADELISRSNKNAIMVVFNTDQHINVSSIGKGDLYDPKFVMQGVNSIRHFADSIPLDCVVFGGDVAGYSGSSLTANGILEAIGLLNEPMAEANVPTISIDGNHDAYQNDNTITSYGMYNVNYKRSKWIKNIYHEGIDNCHSYFDDADHRVRYIFVDTYSRNPAPAVTASSFLTSALSTMGSDYKCLIFSHNSLTNEFAGVITCIDSKGDTRDAFQNPTDLHGIIDNYASQVIACVCGHAHVDAYGISTSGVLYITTASAGRAALAHKDNIPYVKTAGTATDTAFDVMVIDMDAQTLDAIRYGQGSNRLWKYKGTGQGLISNTNHLGGTCNVAGITLTFTANGDSIDAIVGSDGRYSVYLELGQLYTISCTGYTLSTDSITLTENTTLDLTLTQ